MGRCAHPDAWAGRRPAPAPETGAPAAGAYRAHQPDPLLARAAQPSGQVCRWPDLDWARQREQLPPDLRAEIERECEGLALVRKQISLLEAQQDQQVRSGLHPGMALLAQLAGIGTGSAWTLMSELFGWRQFHNRREVAGCLGLTPTPYTSGTSEVQLGISKAGNRRCRWLMVELTWSWLCYQPSSQLSRCFNQRFAGTGKRLRRIGMVALARRLAIALWR